MHKSGEVLPFIIIFLYRQIIKKMIIFNHIKKNDYF